MPRDSGVLFGCFGKNLLPNTFLQQRAAEQDVAKPALEQLQPMNNATVNKAALSTDLCKGLYRDGASHPIGAPRVASETLLCPLVWKSVIISLERLFKTRKWLL